MQMMGSFSTMGKLLGGLVIGVAVLAVIFASSGPFSGLVGIASGSCVLQPPAVAIVGTGFRTIPNRIAVNDGTAFTVVEAAIGTFGANTAITFVAVLADRPTHVVAGAVTEAAVAVTSCNATGTDVDGVPYTAASGLGNSAVDNDAALANNPYSGILLTLFLLIPLGVLVFWGIKKFQDR